MEQPGSRLYSGPLSQAALQILAALRSQSNFSNNHRQMEWYYGSQREPWTQSSSSSSMSQEERTDRNTERPQMFPFSMSHHDSSSERQSSQTSAYYQCSQTPDSSLSSQASSSSCWESSLQRQTSQTERYYQLSQQQTYPHRKFSEPPAAHRTSQTPSLVQREVPEKAAHISHSDGYTLSLQIPERLFEHHCGNSSEEIRPSFTLSHSPDDKRPDEALFPTVKYPKTHKEQLGFVKSCLKTSIGTDSDTLGAAEVKKDTKCCNVCRNELENTVASDRRLKWKQTLSDPGEEATRRSELPQHSEYERIKTGRIHLPLGGFITRPETSCNTHSPELTRHVDVEEVRLAVDSGDQMHNREKQVQCLESGLIDVSLPNKTGLANEKGGFLLLGTNEIIHLGLPATSNNDESFLCRSEGVKSKQKEVYDPEVRDIERLNGVKNEERSVGHHPSSPNNISVPLDKRNQAEKPQVWSQRVTQTTEKHHTIESTKLVFNDTAADNLDRTAEERIDVMEDGFEMETESGTKAGIHTSPGDKMEPKQAHCSEVERRKRECESQRDYKEVTGGDTQAGETRTDTDESVNSEDEEDEGQSTGESMRVDSGRGKCPTLMLSEEFGAREASFRKTSTQTITSIGTSSSTRVILDPTSTFATEQNSSTVQDFKPNNLPILLNLLHQPPVIPSFSLKRKHEEVQHQNTYAPSKIHRAVHPPTWEPFCSPQEKPKYREVSEWKRIRPKSSKHENPAELSGPQQIKVSLSNATEIVSRLQTQQCASKQTQQKHSKMKESGRVSRRTSASVTYKPPKKNQAKSDRDGSETSQDRSHVGEPGPKAGYETETLTSDLRVKDPGKLNSDEKMQMLEEAGQAETLVLTMVYQDGTTQLDSEQKLTPPVCGLFVLMKNDLDRSTPEDTLGPKDSLVYLKLDQTPAWAQKHTHQSQEVFTREMLLQVLLRSQLVVCYKAKDLLRTLLQFYKRDLNWKQIAGCHIQDPQVSGWLLDPADPSSSYQDLLNKHYRKPNTPPTQGTKKVSQIISGLSSLYWLNIKLCSKLQSQGLWELYSDMELKMIPVLAAMESHHIHVDKEALQRTSDLLGTKMKQLEQDAHRAAGQMFLVTSNTQLRSVLFEKLRLHELCDTKKLPRTVNKQQQSTSEAALMQLQDLHPLPKIILEHRQVHKIKSTFVDGILSCMMSKSYISSTWYQTSAVTGRISAKHPNFQALPRQPLQITKKHYIHGKEEEVVTVHPRAMFIPQKGWTFLAADFCQVELRLLAHLSSDPELLRIFTNPQADVFTMLASQWKGVSESEVTSEDREHAKRVVYSVVYGAGRERLSGILGLSVEQAGLFQDSFLQTYREVQAFIQRTIQLCHKQGHVLSIMGRRRILPNINSPDWGVRMQAERQAVNFMVQGSAADLCKMAMIRIFNLVSSTTSLSARLIAQLHDELLFEVEDSQVERFAVLVKSTMESLQHIDHLDIQLKVPLKVAVSTGKSWGSMSELKTSPASSSSSSL